MEVVNELAVGGIALYGPSYVLQNNGYTPKAAVANTLFSGNLPVAQSYDNIEEPFEIFVKGATADAVVANKRALDLALRTARYTAPAVLSLRAKNQSNTGYSEIYSATMQEGPEFIGKEAGAFMMRVAGTWVRSAFWGLLSTGETIMNAASFQNQFSGSPDCFVAFSAGSGDLIYEGSPLNVDIEITNALGIATAINIIVSSFLSLTSDATTQTVTTSSTTPVLSAGGDLISIGAVANANRGVSARLFAQTSAVDVDGQARIKLFFQRSTSVATELSNPFYTSPWFSPTSNTALFDCGTFPLDMFRGSGLTDIYAWLEVKSNSGVSTTFTLSNFYILFYYTYAVMPVAAVGPMNIGQNEHIHIRGFDETTDRPCLPLARARAYTKSSGGLQENYLSLYGTPPAYYSGASLMVAVYSIGAQTLISTHTATVTVKHAPLWRTMRGAS